MSKIFEAMYEWSKMLKEDHIDEDREEIEIGGGNHSRTVTNHVIRVRGKYGETAVVVSYEDHFNISSLTSLSPVYDRHILDVFVVDNSVRFEGYVTRLGLFGRFLRLFGGGGGLRPFNHQLFSEYLVVSEEKNADATDFDNRTFCGEMVEIFNRTELLKLVFQEKTGMSAHIKMNRQKHTVDFIDNTVNACINLLFAKSTSS